MKKILIALLLAHFLVSVVFNAFLSCDSFLSFYGKSKDGLLHRTLDAVTHWKPVYALAKYTGAETGFGFFSPNVLTSSVIVVEKKGKLILPPLSNHESEIRFTNLASHITSKMLEKSDRYDTMLLPRPVLGKYYTLEDIDSAYYNLVFKNIGAPHVDLGNLYGDTVVVKLLLYDYPTLASVRQGSEPRPEFISLYNAKVAVKPRL